MKFLTLLFFTQTFKILYPTYLGNEKRNFYGINPPSELNLKWKIYLGKAKSGAHGELLWAGTGWTGQPLLTEEEKDTFLYIPSLSHFLFKVNAKTGKIIWKTKFLDALKGTPSFYFYENKILILQGSRKGLFKRVRDRNIKTFHIISPFDGKIIFSKKIPGTLSFSKDVDASPLVVNKRIYWACENGYLYKSIIENNKLKTIDSVKLFTDYEAYKHKGNVVVESSPSLLNNLIFVSTGSGHLYGIDTNNLEIKFDFKTGADMDGSPHVLSDRKILFTLEKEFIEGVGGVFLIDPFNKKNPVIWWFPVKKSIIKEWEGGVIGSAVSNEYYVGDSLPRLCVFNGIDGYFYVVAIDKLSDKKEKGPDNKTLYPVPFLVFKDFIGGSISTPLIFKNIIITCSYDGKIRLYEIKFEKSYKGDKDAIKSLKGDYFRVKIKLIDFFKTYGGIESTPLVYNKKIFVGSRDGYFYCVGE